MKEKLEFIIEYAYKYYEIAYDFLEKNKVIYSSP